MKKSNHFIEKILLVFLYIDSLLTLDSRLTLALSLILFGLSLHFQGAKPYSPIFIMILVMEYLGWTWIQLSLIIIGGVLISLVKLYEIPIPGKGELNSGYRKFKCEDLEVGLFYPTKQNSGQKANWYPKQEYSKTMYDIFYANPQIKRIPFFLFDMLTSFIKKVKMPAFLNAKVFVHSEEPQKNNSAQAQSHQKSQTRKKPIKFVLFSHGLGSNLNQYSSICGWFASHNFFVVSVQHDKDAVRLVHKDIPKPSEQPEKTDKFWYQERNKYLQIRVSEMKKVFNSLISGRLLKQGLGLKEWADIEVQELCLVGHSYGGATMLQMYSELITDGRENKVTRVMLLDPWTYPLSPSTYKTIQNKEILVIGTQYFWEVVPYIYKLEEKMHLLKAKNTETLIALNLAKVGHLDQSDPAFVFGNLLQIFKKDSNSSYIEQIMQLNLLIMALYMDGYSQDDILKASNQFCRESKIDQIGIGVFVQERTNKAQIQKFKEQRQAIVKELFAKKNYFQAILR